MKIFYILLFSLFLIGQSDYKIYSENDFIIKENLSNLSKANNSLYDIIIKNKNIYFQKESILGIWNTTEGAIENINIEYNGSSIVLSSEPKSFYYCFSLKGDSVNSIGYLINWPPNYCILNLKNDSLICTEIKGIYNKITHTIFIR